MENINPTSRDLKIFTWIFLVFSGLLGLIISSKPGTLTAVALILAAAVLISLVLNRELSLTRKLKGFLLPTLFGLAGQAAEQSQAFLTVACIAWGAGILFTISMWRLPSIAQKVFIFLTTAAEPIGWTISHIILGLVYYLVITPTGGLMKLFRYDPMNRHINRQADTYWIDHDVTDETERYFRQF